MSNKYFDFDAAMEERKGDPIVVKAFGEKYELPSQLPFDIVLKISRKHKGGEEEMTEDDMIEMAITLFGESAFNAWLKKGITLDGVMLMVEHVMRMYMDKAQETTVEMAANKISNP